MRDREISMNWRPTRALPVLVQMDAERRTMVGVYRFSAWAVVLSAPVNNGRVREVIFVSVKKCRRIK